MQTILKNITDERLRAHIIWLPMFPGDSRRQAQKRSNEFSDARLDYFWDGDQVTGQVWQDVLGIGRLAWDVYFLYDADVQWQEKPTQPDFWMHQLNGVDPAFFLDRQVFEAEARKLLDSTH